MQISMVFADWLVYSGITLVFKFQAVWTTSYHTQFRRYKNETLGGVINNVDIKLCASQSQIIQKCLGAINKRGITLVFKFQAVWTTSYHTQFRFIRTKYQGEFSLVEGFKLAFLREIIYSSCQKIFLKCCLPIFPDWLRQGKNIF
jgi:hypothetical protein